jgi:transposase-like protein
MTGASRGRRCMGRHKKENGAMRKSRFSVEQIVGALKRAELGTPVADVIQQMGISAPTYYRWKKAYKGHLPAAGREQVKPI